MAKDSKIPRTSLPPRPAGQPTTKGENRLTLRMHRDIMDLLSFRAAERGVSRSHLVEQILVGMMRADPRNPKLDPVGRIVADAEAPLTLRERSPVQLADKWRKFATAHEIVIGAPPPQDWLDDPKTYWDIGSFDHRHEGVEDEGHDPIRPAHTRRRRNFD